MEKKDCQIKPVKASGIQTLHLTQTTLVFVPFSFYSKCFLRTKQMTVCICRL